MLVVGAVAALRFFLYRTCCGKWGAVLVLQVGRVVVVQGEPLPVVLGQFPFWMKSSLACGPGLLPGRGMLMVGGVEQVNRLAGEEEAVLASFGHAPYHRFHPAAGA